jgi:hypothetical protein
LRHDTGGQSEVPKINQAQFKLYLENNNGKVTAGSRSYVSLSQKKVSRNLGLGLDPMDMVIFRGIPMRVFPAKQQWGIST